MEKKSKDCEEYDLLLTRLSECQTPKDARAIHKELKAYGDGMPFRIRHPLLLYVISIINTALAILFAILAIKI